MSDHKDKRFGPAEERDSAHETSSAGFRNLFQADQGGARRIHLTEDHVQSVLLVRRARASVLGNNLFSDPAWDMLLELYAAHLGERRVTLAELARVTETPVRIAARWVEALVQSGNISVDRGDQASPFLVYVKLSDEGVARMQRLADQWGSAFVSIA